MSYLHLKEVPGVRRNKGKTPANQYPFIKIRRGSRVAKDGNKTAVERRGLVTIARAQAKAERAKGGQRR